MLFLCRQQLEVAGNISKSNFSYTSCCQTMVCEALLVNELMESDLHLGSEASHLLKTSSPETVVT